MDTTTDFNTIIANYAKMASLKAETARKEAAKIKAEPNSGWAETDRIRDAQAAQASREAKAWEDKAIAAEGGYFLYDINDTAFVMDNQAMVTLAESCGRVKYANPLRDSDPAVQWN